MNIRAKLTTLLQDAVTQAGIEYDGDIALEYPVELSRGDFATPLAMKLGKQLGQNPRELAEQITTHLGARLPSEVDRVEVAGSGYINFILSNTFFASLKQKIIDSKNEWGANDKLATQTYLLEHSSPNLFKPFHIGHLVNNFVGASLERIVAISGAKTHTVSFPSDVSPGIAKAIWGLIDLSYTNQFTIEQVGEAYTHGSQAYKEDRDAKMRIDEINREIYESQDTDAYRLYKEGRALSLEYFQSITTRLGSSFERLFFESECEIVGKEIVRTYTGSVFVESDGAIIFEGSKYGLFDNVFINSQGFGTYLCKDTGLISKKFATYNFDCSLTVTDIEQKQHFQLLKKAVEQINPSWSEKSHFIHHGRLALSSGKISSRDGKVPLAEDLLYEVGNRVLEKMQGRDIDNPEQVAEKVAQSALKYAILRSATGKNIVFDFERDLSFEGTSGPYIQYAFVRAKSALLEAEELLTGSEPAIRTGKAPELERQLLRFPDMVTRSLDDYSPHHIAHYAYELASEFNSFYAQTKIADASNPDMRANIDLVKAVGQTLHNALYLLGIDTVDEM
ncbi:MAG: arginine--tRNA ligase [Patescibacteria group bacterium]